MLEVHKRSGTIEPFDSQKVRASLEATSDEAGQPLNTSDLSSILKDLEDMLKGKQSVTSRQLYIMLAGILYTRGLRELTARYTAYKTNAWKV